MAESRKLPKKRGPKPNRLKIKGDWQSAVGEALKKERTKIDLHTVSVDESRQSGRLFYAKQSQFAGSSNERNFFYNNEL